MSDILSKLEWTSECSLKTKDTLLCPNCVHP